MQEYFISWVVEKVSFPLVPDSNTPLVFLWGIHSNRTEERSLVLVAVLQLTLVFGLGLISRWGCLYATSRMKLRFYVYGNGYWTVLKKWGK